MAVHFCKDCGIETDQTRCPKHRTYIAPRQWNGNGGLGTEADKLPSSSWWAVPTREAFMAAYHRELPRLYRGSGVNYTPLGSE
jgi:hypothetical protein